VWVKRDDLTALPYGGNKVRKLELILADARRRGRRAVLTIGAEGSNHVLATAIYARELGFATTRAVLFPQPPSQAVAQRLRAFRELGVEVTRVAAKPLVPLGLAARALASLRRGDGAPYLIGPGGSSPLGALGYVGAALELAAQIAGGAAPEPREIFVPLGSGGTAAGLLLGLRLAGLATRVVAVEVVPRPWVSPWLVARLATAAARLLAERGARVAALRFVASDLDTVRDQLGPGYGAPTPAAVEAVARAAGAGLTLETTYSGKALAALLARPSPGPRLFWLTYARYRRDDVAPE
jgi:D-cysteine desulfhydrase